MTKEGAVDVTRSRTKANTKTNQLPSANRVPRRPKAAVAARAPQPAKAAAVPDSPQRQASRPPAASTAGADRSHTLNFLGIDPEDERIRYSTTDLIVLWCAVMGILLLGAVIGLIIGKVWH